MIRKNYIVSMTRGPDKQFDRDETLHKAMQLFWNQGYEATGVTDLLSHMAIGRQSMYDTFGNKRALFLEALRAYFAEQWNSVARMLDEPGTAIEKLRHVFESREQMIAEGGHCGCLVGNTAAELGPHDPEVAEILRSFFSEMRSVLAETLRAGQDAGEVRRDLGADEMASVLIVTIQGAALFSKVEEDLETSHVALSVLLRFLEPVRSGDGPFFD